MTRSLRTLAIPAVILTLSCRPQAIKPDQSIALSPTAAEILKASAQKYAECESYQDHGSVVTEFANIWVPHHTRIDFSTAYTRAGQFRFEYRENGILGRETRYEVWKNKDEVKSWWTLRPNVQIHPNIGDALSGPTGVSGGSAYTIPSALMKEAAWKGSNWTSVDRAYRIGDGLSDNTPYFRIQRLTATRSDSVGGNEMPATKGKVTYWIRKDSFLLVRVDEETDFGSFFARRRTTYSPRINQAIPASMFLFDH